MANINITKEEENEGKQVLMFAKSLNLSNLQAMHYFLWGFEFGKSTKSADEETA